VDAFNRLPPPEDWFDDLRATAYTALRRLRELGWPDREDPARCPLAHERAEMLDKAITAMAPNKPAPQVRPRRIGRFPAP
jgi:hypothetical protein